MHIKTIMLTLALLAILQNAAVAQKLAVENMTAAPMDLSASQYERKDLAGQPCGLVKVQLATMGAKFEGNIVGKTEYKTGEYWVYMEEGAYMLTVKHPNYVPLKVNFRDYNINGIAAKTTYTLTLLMPQTTTAVKEQRLIVNYTPADATVLIDSKLHKGNGRVEMNLALGSHSYIIAAEGYETAEGSVKLNGGSPRTITENLVAIARTQPVQHQTETPQQNPVPLTGTTAQHSTTSSNGVTKSNIETFTVNGVSFNMVRVDGGTFTMGATPEQGNYANAGEKPAHQVTLSTYSIGETEVTQALWKAVMGSKPSKFKGDNQPVERVSWEDCQLFLQKLNQLTGQSFRLPTEAEWEFAARGGNKSRGYKYSGSNDINAVAWWYDTKRKTPQDVKTKIANELGIYDMSGNVWEWCLDWFDNYNNGSQTNPKGAHSGYVRVVRGGGWDFSDWSCRVSYRNGRTPNNRFNDLGLRLAL